MQRFRPPLRTRPLSEWRLPDGSSGISIELLWQGPDGAWRGIWASGATWKEAERAAFAKLDEATARLAPAPAPPARAA
jgi:hypothetical protein